MALPLPIWNTPGDSGSPIFGYNKKSDQWELVAIHLGSSDDDNISVPIQRKFINTTIAEDTAPDVNNSDSK